MRNVRSAVSTISSYERVDENQRRYGRQTESLFLAHKTEEKKGQETGGRKPWQSMFETHMKSLTAAFALSMVNDWYL